MEEEEDYEGDSDATLNMRGGGRGVRGVRGRGRGDVARVPRGEARREDDRGENFHRRIDRPFKMNIEKFHGDMDVEGFLNWMDSVEKYFDCMDLTEDQKVNYVAFKMESGAAVWWRKE